MQAAELSQFVKSQASSLGLDLCGIAKAGPIGRETYLASWLAQGRHGSMGYLEHHADRRIDPSVLLPGAKSVIVVGLSYKQPEPRTPLAPSADADRAGRVAMYAWGEDYHRVLKDKLHELVGRLRSRCKDVPSFEAKVCVDTAPIVEREFAAAAGLGWIGKNTLVLHPALGSFFFLGAVVTTLELPPDEPMADHCGTCTACLDACPTKAFPVAYEMDAQRCISYLTIEHRGEIPTEFHAAMGDWLFGCDVCQTVCPHNRHAPPSNEPRFASRGAERGLDLQELLSESDQESRRRFADSAMDRATPAMLRRNALIVMKNQTIMPASTGAES